MQDRDIEAANWAKENTGRNAIIMKLDALPPTSESAASPAGLDAKLKFYKTPADTAKMRAKATEALAEKAIVERLLASRSLAEEMAVDQDAAVVAKAEGTWAMQGQI